MVTQARRWAKEINCPVYDGVGEIPESESPYLIALSKDGMSAWRVRRKFVEAGMSDDPDALLDEALAGDLEDLEEWDDSAAADEEEAAGDIGKIDPWYDDPMFHLPTSGSTEDMRLPSRNNPPHDEAPKE